PPCPHRARTAAPIAMTNLHCVTHPALLRPLPRRHPPRAASNSLLLRLLPLQSAPPKRRPRVQTRVPSALRRSARAVHHGQQGRGVKARVRARARVSRSLLTVLQIATKMRTRTRDRLREMMGKMMVRKVWAC
ncbi:hypothetical protein FRC06_007367, partial [Ceratobasidium sp. 370]